MQEPTNHFTSNIGSTGENNATARGQVFLVHGKVGCIPYARKLATAVGGAFRAPHHSCSDVGVLGELSLAAGGTLLLDEFIEFRLGALYRLVSTWSRMADGVRPALVLTLRPSSDEAMRLLDLRHLEKIAHALPPINRHVVLDENGCPDEANDIPKTPTSILRYEIKKARVALQEAKSPYGIALSSPSHVAEAAQALIGDSAQEHFLVFHLDCKNKVIGYTEAARGGLDSCPVDPRCVFRACIAAGASALVVAHNHPSGHCTPSAEDKRLTERLKKSAELLGLILLDHVIVSDEAHLSFAERGIL